VLPFTPDASDADSTRLAERLTEGVTAELVHDGRFGVVASSAARAAHSRERRPRDISSALDAGILVEARITTDADRVRVEARVMDGPREEKAWVRGFAGTLATTDELEREIATAVADAVGALRPRNQ
jgi:TolB-like protein